MWLPGEDVLTITQIILNGILLSLPPELIWYTPMLELDVTSARLPYAVQFDCGVVALWRAAGPLVPADPRKHRSICQRMVKVRRTVGWLPQRIGAHAEVVAHARRQWYPLARLIILIFCQRGLAVEFPPFTFAITINNALCTRHQI